MGDEGVGVHAIRYLEENAAIPGVELLDGGTGSFLLLEPMQRARKVILIDATLDGKRPGTISRIVPRYSSDYPPTLTAHDIGLKDLLDVFYLLGKEIDVTLFAVSIAPLSSLDTELTPQIGSCLPEIAANVVEEIGRS